MKQIAKWSLRKLHNQECFGFLKGIKAATDSLPTSSTGGDDGPQVQDLSARSSVGASEQLDQAVEDFNEKFDRFDETLKDSEKNPAVALASDLDEQRDKFWRLLNAYTKVMAEHPTEAVATASGKARDIMEKYGDPTDLAQTEETGVIHNALADIAALDEEDKEQSGILPWFNKLSDVQKAFEEADRQRAKAESTKTKGVIKEARREAEAAFRDLAKVVNAAVIFNGEAPYAEFIDEVNALMDRQGTISDRRDTINAKKRKEESEGEGGTDDRPVVQ